MPDTPAAPVDKSVDNDPLEPWRIAAQEWVYLPVTVERPNDDDPA